MIIAAVAIIICWLLGGIIGGAEINAWIIKYTIRLLFSMVAYSSFMTFIGMRFRKIVTSASLGVLAFQGAFSSIIVIFMIAGRAMGTALGTIMRIFGNSLAVGRWFANSQLSDPEMNVNVLVSIIISLVMAVIYYAIGTYKINKRDLT
jgi:hypothetical protein